MAEILQQVIVSTAATCSMRFSIKNGETPHKDNPWFDQDCKLLKRELNSLLRKCKSLYFSSDLIALYTEKKRTFYKTTNDKKKLYHANIVNELTSSKSSKAFWKSVNYFIFKTKNINPIPPEV